MRPIAPAPLRGNRNSLKWNSAGRANGRWCHKATAIWHITRASFGPARGGHPGAPCGHASDPPKQRPTRPDSYPRRTGRRHIAWMRPTAYKIGLRAFVAVAILACGDLIAEGAFAQHDLRHGRKRLGIVRLASVRFDHHHFEIAR